MCDGLKDEEGKMLAVWDCICNLFGDISERDWECGVE